MAVYLVTGKLGTGKTKIAVMKAREALLTGRRVASNVDLHLENLVPKLRKARYCRLPDKPNAQDLAAVGHGNPESYDEERNGIMILDELGSWLNSRAFQDPRRSGVIDWLIHARKHGWDVWFIAQSVVQIDKQIRESLAEYVVNCIRFDKVKVPVVGAFGVRLPRFHLAVCRIGSGATSMVAWRESYRGDDVHSAYNTRQIFREDPEAAVFSVLSESYFTDAVAKPLPWWRRVGARAAQRHCAIPPPPTLRPKLPHVQAAMQLPADRRLPVLRAAEVPPGSWRPLVVWAS